jgi:hypothetical protein
MHCIRELVLDAAVTACQCSGSASQSGRFATKVQVRTCAIRFESVSISPSVRSALRDLGGEPVDGILPLASGIHRGSLQALRASPARSCGNRAPGSLPTTARRRS